MKLEQDIRKVFKMNKHHHKTLFAIMGETEPYREFANLDEFIQAVAKGVSENGPVSIRLAGLNFKTSLDDIDPMLEQLRELGCVGAVGLGWLDSPSGPQLKVTLKETASKQERLEDVEQLKEMIRSGWNGPLSPDPISLSVARTKTELEDLVNGFDMLNLIDMIQDLLGQHLTVQQLTKVISAGIAQGQFTMVPFRYDQPNVSLEPSPKPTGTVH